MVKNGSTARALSCMAHLTEQFDALHWSVCELDVAKPEEYRVGVVQKRRTEKKSEHSHP